MESHEPAAISMDPDRGAIDGGLTRDHVRRQDDAVAQLRDLEIHDVDRLSRRDLEILADGSSRPDSAARAELDEVLGDQAH